MKHFDTNCNQEILNPVQAKVVIFEYSWKTFALFKSGTKLSTITFIYPYLHDDDESFYYTLWWTKPEN